MDLKAANREGFPYIMHIVDEPRKFSPSNVLTYTVYVVHNVLILAKYVDTLLYLYNMF